MEGGSGNGAAIRAEFLEEFMPDPPPELSLAIV